ncbi:olfactory receptor 287-like [Rhinophrynus dorsalis]
MPFLNNTTFILVGFSLRAGTQTAVFVLFLVVYLLSLMGNMSIITAIWLGKHLHTPMYYFLCSLAVLDIWFISSTVPKLLIILSSNNRSISLSGCIFQLYFYLSLGSTEFYLLAFMSLDRFVAICFPLRYNAIITSRVSLWLILLSWIGGLSTFIYPTVLILGLSFCGPYEINHFFCDSSAMVKISCSKSQVFNLAYSIAASSVILSSFSMTLVSYCHILFTITKIHSASAKKKAFSTCTSHFIAVSLAYGSAIFIYVRPVESSSPDLNKIVALLNSVLTPLLNPIIYSLRNNQVQQVFKAVICGLS